MCLMYPLATPLLSHWMLYSGCILDNSRCSCCTALYCVGCCSYVVDLRSYWCWSSWRLLVVSTNSTGTTQTRNRNSVRHVKLGLIAQTSTLPLTVIYFVIELFKSKSRTCTSRRSSLIGWLVTYLMSTRIEQHGLLQHPFSIPARSAALPYALHFRARFHGFLLCQYEHQDGYTFKCRIH